MSAPEWDVSASHVMPYEPQPTAHIWIDRDGKVASVIVANCPEGVSLDDDPTVLMFDPTWNVIVTDLGARP